MTPIKSTVEILAFKVLNRNIDKSWINWGVEMLMADYDNENLAILAGECEPYNQFYLQDLTTKILDELSLDYSDKEQTIKSYVCYLVEKALNGELEVIQVLTILKDLCIELEMEISLYQFYLLYFAKTDLLESEVQWYIEDVDNSNIDSVIIDYFTTWIFTYDSNKNNILKR